MNRGLAVLTVVASGCLALPAPLHAEEPSNTMMATSWSLEKAGKAPPRRQNSAGAANTAHGVRPAPAKPRVFGGATVTNQGKRNQGKARAQLGVALPF